jgi:arylformamidase
LLPQTDKKSVSRLWTNAGCEVKVQAETTGAVATMGPPKEVFHFTSLWYESRRMASFFKRCGLILAVFLGAGCALTNLASLRLMYEKAHIPESHIHRDLAYREGPGEDDPKQRLDLYVPDGKDWPVLVFVHGGGWDSGDRALTVAGVDIYANIGRFFASHGVGTAVISYRLLPQVAWRDQIKDVAGAVAWVYRNAAKYGGDPKRLFLAGHSAGAQLVARVALDPEPLEDEGLDKRIVSGVVAVSGAGYEISSEEALSARGARKGYYQRRFEQGDTSGAWAGEVSILRFIDKGAPPFLIIYGTAEPKGLHQRSEMLAEKLRSFRVPTELTVVPHRDHVQMVMTMSREGETTQAMLNFLWAL